MCPPQGLSVKTLVNTIHTLYKTDRTFCSLMFVQGQLFVILSYYLLKPCVKDFDVCM